MNREDFFALLNGMSYADLSVVQMAYWVAKNAHRLQPPRDSGERYFEHPREVAVTLINRGHREQGTIVRALMHDVIEDTNTPIQVVLQLFGHDVWRSLVILSKYVPLFDPVTGQTLGRYKKQAEVYWAEIMQASHEDRLVKIADRFCNLGSMKSWPEERRVKYANETKQYVLPIAENTDPWFTQKLIELVNEHLP